MNDVSLRNQLKHSKVAMFSFNSAQRSSEHFREFSVKFRRFRKIIGNPRKTLGRFRIRQLWQGENLTHLTQKKLAGIWLLVSRKLLSKYICLIRPCCLWSFSSQESFVSDSSHHVGFPLSSFTDLVLMHTWLSSHSVYSWTSLRLHSLCLPQGGAEDFFFGGDLEFFGKGQREGGGCYQNFWQTKRRVTNFFFSTY